MRRKIRLKPRSGKITVEKPRYRVQLFRPLGLYPQGTYCNQNGFLHADDDMVFAVTYGCGWRDIEDLPYSEVDWLDPEIIRLLGSMMLSEDFDNGIRCRFYPIPYGGFEIDERRLDLTNTTTAKLVKAALIETIDSVEWNRYIRSTWEACLDCSFNLTTLTASSKRLQRRCYVAFPIENHVLMRGVQALIKADMLSQHYEFQEEAAIATFIALDASFELVLRHLKLSGINKPTAKEAGNWLYQTFDEPMGFIEADGLKYFEDFYDSRIKTIHPGSRFGDSPYAPLMIDDRIHLREMLPQVFAYLILGEHTPHFQRRIEAARPAASTSD